MQNPFVSMCSWQFLLVFFFFLLDLVWLVPYSCPYSVFSMVSLYQNTQPVNPRQFGRPLHSNSCEELNPIQAKMSPETILLLGQLSIYRTVVLHMVPLLFIVASCKSGTSCKHHSTMREGSSCGEVAEIAAFTEDTEDIKNKGASDQNFLIKVRHHT